jgi:hypothetical protein
VKAIVEAQRPQTRRQLMSLLGLVGFFRRFIPNFADLTAPLTDLLRGKHKFDWTDEAEQSFNMIKDVMTRDSILLIPDFNKPFTVHVDASDRAAAAVLPQSDKDGNLRPVCYCSKNLTDAQRRYTVTDKEALSLLLAVRAFRIFLGGKTVIYTDHEPLKFNYSNAANSRRLFRWSIELQPYDLEIKHIIGLDNVIADFLSRPV